MDKTAIVCSYSVCFSESVSEKLVNYVKGMLQRKGLQCKVVRQESSWCALVEASTQVLTEQARR